jgi:dCTP deaminase
MQLNRNGENMAVLAKEDIKAYIDSGKLKIEPFVPENVGPCSIDLTLGNYFKVYEIDQTPSIDLTIPKLDIPVKEVRRENAQKFTFHPGTLVLGMTAEQVGIPNDLVGQITGRSSFARLGLIVEMAPRIDPGFYGNITLEIANQGPLAVSLNPGIRFCSLMLEELSRPTIPYRGKYLGIDKPEVTKIALELRVQKKQKSVS